MLSEDKVIALYCIVDDLLKQCATPKTSAFRSKTVK